MIRFCIAAILLVIAGKAMAQFTVTGSVRDAKDKSALPGATIQTEGPSAVTDEWGSFRLEKLPAGEHILIVKFLGYADKTETISLQGNTTIELELEELTVMTDEVVVLSTRATDKTPTTYTNVNRITIQKQNFGQDLPLLLNWTPSVVTTSDAGAGIGYTGIRIRGSDGTRINVTLNGIPYNDSESQGVYWVDVPDIATSTQTIQVQRGVGTSSNGAGAFGATINLQTNTRNDQAYADVINSAGSFGTQKHTIGIGSGLINNKFVFDGRMTKIKSDGFIDRATSDLSSYYFSGGYYGKKTMVKAIVFGGNEVTYQSWWGVPESRLTGNVPGMLQTAADEGWNAEQTQNLLTSGNRTFNNYLYKDQVDNYGQYHYQLHLSHRFTEQLTANVSGHSTFGKGYYEEYRYDETLANYGIPNPIFGTDTVKSSDLVRRRWLDNEFYGFTFSLNYEKEKWNSTLGGGWNEYSGDHYGEVTWAAVSATVPKDYRYYFNNGNKKDFNMYWKNNYQLTERLNAFVDLQIRTIRYKALGTENELQGFDVDVNYQFFNPKFGLTWQVGERDQLYASYAIGNREPVRDDFVNAPIDQDPKHETLRDLEVGFRKSGNNYFINANYYFMDYTNQLVLTGQLNDVGASLRTNVDKSYRMGVELEGMLRITKQLTWNANITLSQNKIDKFTEVLYDYGPGFDQYSEQDLDHKNTDISFSPNVIGGSALTYRVLKGLDISLLSKYVGKQYLDNTSDDTRKIAAYFTNDFRFTYSIRPSWMREIGVSLLVNNVFNTQYESNGYTWGYYAGLSDQHRQNYYYPQAGRNFMAMLTLRF